MSALNQLYASKEDANPQPTAAATQKQSATASNIFAKDLDEAKQHLVDLATTSNHYCIVESDHPYRSGAINTFRVCFPETVQWFTIEFDPQCGTAQPEDCLYVSIPQRMDEKSERSLSGPTIIPVTGDQQDANKSGDEYRFTVCKNTTITTVNSDPNDDDETEAADASRHGAACVVRQFNTPGAWTQAALVLPGNRVDFSLETATHYTRDAQANRYGFRCLIVGYENPAATASKPSAASAAETDVHVQVAGNNNSGGGGPSLSCGSNGRNACLTRLECELAYLGGMCSANLMRKDLVLPGDGTAAAAAMAAGAEEVASRVEDALQTHASLMSKGLALADSVLTVNQALDTYLPMG